MPSQMTDLTSCIYVVYLRMILAKQKFCVSVAKACQAEERQLKEENSKLRQEVERHSTNIGQSAIEVR